MRTVVTADGSSTLYSPKFQQTFHSEHGAETESRIVFLEGSGILDRLREQSPSSILEVGLGAGLNFLLSADAALAHQCKLDYTAFEIDLLNIDEFESLNYATLLSQPQLCELITAVIRGDCRDRLSKSINSVTLTTYCRDICNVELPQKSYDAIYLDAFSPRTNAECWSPTMLRKYFNALKVGGKLTTYSAQGILRRNLLEQGFAVNRLPGPPGKREFLVATRQ